jgi:hypothetical protein
LLRRLFGNQRGSVSIIAAASLPVLLGFGGLAVDVSLWHRAKNGVQGAADAAASSVAASHKKGDPETRLTAEAIGVAAANGFPNGVGGIAVALHHPPISGSQIGLFNAYEVVVSAPQQLYLANYFANAFGLAAPTVTGRAVALNQTSPACLVALSGADNPNGTLTTSGGAVLKATNCDIADNSPNAKSINTSGGGSITGKNIITVGNYLGNVVADPGTITTGAGVTADPYKYARSIPPLPAYEPSSANNWSGHITNPTGVKAFNGNVSVSGSSGAQLDPGVYIINGSFSTSKALSGTGVTIVITGPAAPANSNTFSLGGSATLQLTAPTTGSTAGIALWIDGRMSHASDNLTGSSTPSITGAVYAPSHEVKFAGNSMSATSLCTQVIASEIVVTGTPTFQHDCAGVAILDPLGPKWSLVE